MTDRMMALGLMSGTSLDGIDAALLETDGRVDLRPGPSVTVPYEPELREGIRALLGRSEGPAEDVERAMTLAHVEAVEAVLGKAGIPADAVDLIGFHGHTIDHRPSEGRTWQIGDGPLLAERTGIDVVYDLRARDVEEGGQGAPLAPIFHAAITQDLRRNEPSIAVLNVGGVANATWIGGAFDAGADVLDVDAIQAFDTGPGNAMIDDWVRRHTGRMHDTDGVLAASGKVDHAVLETLLDDPFFAAAPPKSLDRNDFDMAPVEGLSAADGAATLTAFTATAVARGLAHFPTSARASGATRWFVAGGGRHNPALMNALRCALDDQHVAPIDDVGWDGDAIEAHAFAYFAVRSRLGLPITMPPTTGVRKPVSGGRFAPVPRHGKRAGLA